MQPDPRGKRSGGLRPAWDALSTTQLLESLQAAASAVRDAEAGLRDQVAALRARGASWSEIARALGVSRQAAWERFAD